MIDYSNKRKAIELASKYFPVGLLTSEVKAQVDCQDALIEMAKWKDHLFRDFLSRRIEVYNTEADKWFKIKNLENVGVISKIRVDTVKELLNNFFSEDIK